MGNTIITPLTYVWDLVGHPVGRSSTVVSIRLLICGPESIVRSALHHLLASTEQIEVVGDPVTSENAVRVARETLPDVVLLEMAPESANDVETTKELTRR
jgi:DNA-binding NarL/FixJ family response regulator